MPDNHYLYFLSAVLGLTYCYFILARKSIILDSQHPDGLEKIRELEAQGHPARLEVEEPQPCPPRFVSPLQVFILYFIGKYVFFL